MANRWNRQRVIDALQAYWRQGHFYCNPEIPTPVRMAALYLFGTWREALLAAGLIPANSPPSRRHWTDAQLFAEIRSRSVPGSPMRVPQDRKLAAVAINRFGSWHCALRAAGVEPVPWRKWSPQRVLAEIRAWHGNDATMNSHDRLACKRLITAARGRFGSWRNALIAAGLLAPNEYQKFGRKWTTDRVVETIQDRHVHCQPLLTSADNRLYAAAVRHFDSWHAALTAAGVPATRKKNRTPRRWTSEKVIEQIHLRCKEGCNIFRLSRIDTGLVAAGRRFFGSWRAAMEAAGLQTKPRCQWSRQKVIAAIRTHERQGTIWQIWKIDKKLFDAGQKYFGAWKQAVRAAGLTPRCLPWSKGRVLRELHRRYRLGEYNLGVVDPRLADAMRRYFGSRFNAYKAAGLPPRNCCWPKERILETIRENYRRGLPIERAGFGDIPLQRAARRQFGSWRAAVATAGISLKETGR